MFLFEKLNNRPTKQGRILLLTLSVVLACMFTMGAVFDTSRKKITLVQVDAFSDVETVRTISTRKDTVAAFLQENRIQVGEYDQLNMQDDEKLYDEAKIVVRKGKVFELVADDKLEVVTTTENTVEKALEEIGAPLGPDDLVEPGRDTSITDGLTVTVTRISVTEEKIETPIPYEVIEQPDATLYVGTNKILTEGEEGVLETVYKVVTKEGEEQSREVVSETVVKEPVNAVKGVGTKPIPKSSVQEIVASGQKKGKDFTYSRKLTVLATAYDTSPEENGGYARTAYGLTAQFGVVAVDPKVIPLGSKLYIESADGGKSWTYGYCIAGDTGGAIKGNRVDLCYNTQKECVNFGKRNATVYILD